MKMVYGILTLLILQGCTSMSKNLPPQPTVARVEIPRFMGKWYVIACIPTFLEKGAFNATEAYAWNEEKDRIDVDFSYNKDGFEGPEKHVAQKAFIYNKETNAEWRDQPIWPLKFAYLIVDLASDYSDTIVGVPNREHVWIMAREPQLREARYEELVKKVKSLGYDVSQLQKVPQNPGTQTPMKKSEAMLARANPL
jgi:apolipoprotein D and lipocalin family protein